MNNPLKVLSSREKVIWLISVSVVVASNFFSEKIDPLTLIAAIVGVTSLIFAAKGHVIAQVLMILFSILYAVISFRFCYWGEMITYLGMSLPMAIWSLITWCQNPSVGNKLEVAIQKLTVRQFVLLAIACVVVTGGFYYLLLRLDTPNLAISTISIATNFLAASLTAMRSSYYGLGYASNDFVLIVMWILASLEDASYIPVVVNFAVFFFNDMYGFISWKKRETKQKSE